MSNNVDSGSRGSGRKKSVSERLSAWQGSATGSSSKFGNPDALPEWPIRSLIVPKYETVSQAGAHIYILLDRSGSMNGIWQATIESVNSFLSRAKKSGEKAVVTVAVFDDDFDVVIDHQPLDELEMIDEAAYPPRGMTPLLDSLGRAIVLADRVVIAGEVGPSDVLVVTVTDGGENASQNVSSKRLQQVVKSREHLGYEFLYLGANQDSFSEAAAMGVRYARNWDATDRGTRVNMARSARLMSRKIGGERLDSLEEECFDLADADVRQVEADTGKSAPNTR